MLIPSLNQKREQLSAEYTSKFVNENCVVPDPVSLKDGWLKERRQKRDSILQWSSTDDLYIANFICLTQPDFLKRLQSDHKQGKCCQYFTCEFVEEVLYHPITAASKLCFLKLQSLHSGKNQNLTICGP